MRETSFCTVVSASHLRFAVALDRALRVHHPETILTILVLDPQTIAPACLEGLATVGPADLDIPDFEAMTRRYDAFALSCNLKPFLVSHVLRHVSRKVVLLDADIFVVGRFDRAFAVLDEAWFALTPHVLELSLIDRCAVPATQLADLGTYNGGLWAARACAESVRLLDWLERLLANTDLDFAEQKMLPLAAQLAGSGFRSIDDPGYNIAYWNAHERAPVKTPDGWRCGEGPAVFFHLSGYDESRPTVLTRYWPADRPQPDWAGDLLRDYAALVPSQPEWRGMGFAYDRIGSRRLTPAMRRYYRERGTFAGFRRHRVSSVFGALARAAGRRLRGA